MLTINKKGIGILELMVVVAIIGIMAAAAGPRYSVYKKKQSMSFARTQLTNDIRYTQNYTLSNTKFPDGSNVSGGYGIRFQKNSGTYIIFGDKIQGANNPNGQYDPASSGLSKEFLESAELPGGVKITNLRINKGVGFTDVAGGYVDYVSVPPYGKIFIDNTTSNVILEITFSSSDGSISEIFNLRSSGFIS